MVRKVSGWTEIIVRACLEGMGDIDEEESLDVWLKEDVGASYLFQCAYPYNHPAIFDLEFGGYRFTTSIV